LAVFESFRFGNGLRTAAFVVVDYFLNFKSLTISL